MLFEFGHFQRSFARFILELLLRYIASVIGDRCFAFLDGNTAYRGIWGRIHRCRDRGNRWR
ncbi:hypothetical protein ASD58_29030 [Duganella sp. Root1480D1]|nr:hypothetical protein ASD58_29030 [Duganella sp. Root1480D1]